MPFPTIEFPDFEYSPIIIDNCRNIISGPASYSSGEEFGFELPWRDVPDHMDYTSSLLDEIQ
jgi:hypothetical protein